MYILSGIHDFEHCSGMYIPILLLMLYSIIDLCTGIILKMARLIKDGSQGMKNTPESLIKPPAKTLIIPGKELVQVIAKVCCVTSMIFASNSMIFASNYFIYSIIPTSTLFLNDQSNT